ncbi:hypothetical protein CGC20_24470 [Leishmania donovani]|uniref:Uncharacterized protein n=1 Tax=Leishmania donovani TaxID=5661 RepID=A0A504X874_LEIDO|nr:hypothetical protein CGC21_9375 [Leishmania donovani]TPP51873.1 hypothetical protein CGC20_24470 [Leishmania donovani]
MAETAGEEDVRRMSREERIASYRELEVEVQLRTLAQLLNEEETIQVTPGLMKKVEKSPETGEVLTTIIYPPPSMPNTASSSPALRPAPYEVLFDERDWYPCVITGVVPPAKDVDRVQYKAWILGHNVEEIVYSEALRPWQPTASTSDIQGGVSCHVIDPQTGRYVEGVVDRLTLEETVLVKVPVAPSTSTAFYSQLHKVAKDADDWQALIGDMMGVGSGGGGGKKHKRRRLQ